MIFQKKRFTFLVLALSTSACQQGSLDNDAPIPLVDQEIANEVPPGAVPHCSLIRTEDVFAWRIRNAQHCSYSLNNQNMGAIDCNSGTVPLSAFGVGDHTVSLLVYANGTSVTCNDSFTVYPEAEFSSPIPLLRDGASVPDVYPGAMPHCSLFNTGDVFAWRIRNAKRCNYTLDEQYIGPIECNSGSVPLSKFAVGEHTVSMNAISNGYRNECTSSFTVSQPPKAACSISNNSEAVSWKISNAVQCSWTDNGVPMGSLACADGAIPLGSFTPDGHSLEISVTGDDGLTVLCNLYI